MLIAKRHVSAFLGRARRDWRQFKRLSPAELDAQAGRLATRPPIWSRLKLHQKVGFLVGAMTRRFAFVYDTGTGKTVIALALARYFQRSGVVGRVLVLVPRRANKDEWRDEIRKHSLQTTVCVLTGSMQERLHQLETTDALLIIETYGALMQMTCDLVTSKKKGRNRMQMSPILLGVLSRNIDGLIFDEAHHLGNKASLTWRIVRQLVKSANIVFTLTATPFGRDPEKIWSQMYLIDNGWTLGETLGLFRAAMFKNTRDRWTGLPTFEFDSKRMPELHRMLAHCSLHYPADQAELPQVVPIQKYASLPEDADAYYQRAKQAIIDAHGNVGEMKNGFLRMRQISSGYLGYRDDDGKAEYEFPDNPKLDLLLSIVEAIPPQHKVIIYHEFIFSGQRVMKALADIGLAPLWLYGGTPNVSFVLDAFKRDPKRQIMLMQTQFGEGLNLQAARYGIYYELPVSPIVRRQTQARIVRPHSEHRTVFIYDLLVRGTMDEKILKFCAQGKDLFRGIVQGDVKL